MNNLNIVQMLMHYKFWANNLFFDAISNLPPEEIIKERDNLFKNMLRCLNHIYIVDQIWQAHLEERTHNFTDRNPEEYPTLEQLRKQQDSIDKWYIDYSLKLSQEELKKQINYKLINGTPGVMTREEILFHIINHTTYHRGFLADMFYQIPVKPPATDLPIFLQNKSYN